MYCGAMGINLLNAGWPLSIGMCRFPDIQGAFLYYPLLSPVMRFSGCFKYG
jgi:hypothetical protein